ncbi:UBA domain-containing protein [Lachnellula occidentalis]|uniref:UBA domain-containing protein n=1 Tax=Lachnellula occidentalis TaxID=215460 RepID=A0A8H8UKJ9_9HELO|nr:UBA domain-containing protein [Lachnellula occidentalis]
MDDLNGLEWSASSSSNSTKAPSGTGNYYPTLQPTPPPQLSGRTTPLPRPASGAPKSSALAAPKSVTQDSFSNLVSFGSSKTNTLSLQEQQAKLVADKRKQEEEKKRQYETQFGSSQAWDGLGNRSTASTPSITSRSATPATMPLPTNFARPAPPAKNGSNTANNADDDLFAAFNADTKVDNASFYPPPSIPSSGTNTPSFGGNTVDLSQPQAWEQPSSSLGGDTFGDDDDPFGLGQMKSPKSTPIATTDDDDFLGDLGKPVEEVRRRSPATKEVATTAESQAESDDPWDKAVAELVDMGFSAEQSRGALTESGSGLDIQAAVGWILNDAHRQAKQKQVSRDPSRNNGPSNGDVSRDRPRRDNNPAWMREEGRDRSQPRREDNSSPNSEMDLSKTAAAVGIAEFQQDGDPSQPKWMREAAEREQEERKAIAEGRPRREKSAPVDATATDEALMLDSGPPPPRKAKAPEPRFPPSSSNPSRDQSPALSRPPERVVPTPRWQQTASSDPRSRINKQAVEEQSAQAYVSPARRKKAIPQPSQPTPEPDLLFSSGSSSQPKQAPSKPAARTIPIPSKPSTPIQTRSKAPPRNIPSVSPTALAKSHEHRQAGTTHFKRGDYASAHQSYSASLMSLPTSHPITIILLCNRALTSLKTGIPKSAVSDADTALALIGPAQGHSEIIDLGSEKKEMREFYGKALMRKAEALEQMEKWRDAGEVWKLCVENGVGGSTAIQGRTRCDKALAPKPAKAATPKPQPRPPAKSAMQDLNTNTNSAAVERLRKANIDAEKADDEKFALADKVEAKISTWRDGKRDNLRALLGSLDNVMWEGSAWKKVGMHELVQNNKVKINYMKAIGKCHPDKLPQNSTMETQMLAALIFATLNESWDGFKAQNGM